MKDGKEGEHSQQLPVAGDATKIHVLRDCNSSEDGLASLGQGNTVSVVAREQERSRAQRQAAAVSFGHFTSSNSCTVSSWMEDPRAC